VSPAFRFRALAAEQFAPLFQQTDGELAALGARRMVVTERPGFPCRVSLADGEIGESVILLPFMHHDVDSPYRASGPIFVRAGAQTAEPGVNEVPTYLRHRLLSVRGYDAAGIMTAAEVVEGSDLEAVIGRLFADETIQYLDIHNARPGCYNCRVERAA
jgi:hypothetical protein